MNNQYTAIIEVVSTLHKGGFSYAKVNFTRRNTDTTGSLKGAIALNTNDFLSSALSGNSLATWIPFEGVLVSYTYPQAGSKRFSIH